MLFQNYLLCQKPHGGLCYLKGSHNTPLGYCHSSWQCWMFKAMINNTPYSVQIFSKKGFFHYFVNLKGTQKQTHARESWNVREWCYNKYC